MPQDITSNKIFSAEPGWDDFAILESLVNNVHYLDPADKTKAAILFLYDVQQSTQRGLLKKQLEILLETCETNNTVEDILKFTESICADMASLLAKNTWELIKNCRELEKSYRCLSLFFENTAISEVNNLVLLNAGLEQLADIDNTRFIDFANVLLRECFDRLELTNSYSMIVIPGYLFFSPEAVHDKALQIWGKIAHQNKAMLITDFRDLDEAMDVGDLVKDSGHQGNDDFRSSIIMTCNYLLARRCYDEYGEEENLYIPGSPALAGKLYKMPLARIASAKSMGNISSAQAVHFDIRLSELLALEESGLVTMTNKSGKVQPYSNRTLYNGNSSGLKKYSTVRLFHHISKVLIDIINRTAFEAWTSSTQQGLITRIMKFLNGMQGHEMLIRNFRLIRCEREGDNENDPMLNLEISFELASNKDFRLSMQASMGYGSYEWNSEYGEIALYNKI